MRPEPSRFATSLPLLLAAALAALLTAAAAAPAGAQPRFEILDLNDLNGLSVSILAAIDDRGVIIGSSDIESPGSLMATVWTDGRATVLGTLEGDDLSEAADGNEAGRVAGASIRVEDRGRIIIFDPTAVVFEGGTITDLESLVESGQNWQLLSATSVNGSGAIVGTGRDRDREVPIAYRFAGGVMTELGTLGGFSTDPTAISDAGLIVGQSWTSGGQNHAFVWEDGVMTDLGTFGGRDSRAFDVNEHGQIVGWSQSPASPTLATLWEDGEATNLGTLGGNQSHAAAINEKAQIVGFSTDAQNGAHMFFWGDGQMIDPIATLPPALGFAGRAVASDINEAGQFVGTAFRTGRGDAPVVLTPVDLLAEGLDPAIAGEPATLTVSGLTPGERVFVVFGESAGMSRTGAGCPGAPILISEPRLAGRRRADQDGEVTLERRVPPGAQGRTFRVQAVERSTCRASNVLSVTVE